LKGFALGLALLTEACSCIYSWFWVRHETKTLAGTNTLAYFEGASITKKKLFYDNTLWFWEKEWH
jgi:hypothetical protein